MKKIIDIIFGYKKKEPEKAIENNGHSNLVVPTPKAQITPIILPKRNSDTVVISLLKWFKDNLNEVSANLNPSAKLTEITSLENKFCVKFDNGFKALYCAHNGQSNKVHTGFFYGLEFLSLDRVLKMWEMSTHMVDDLKMMEDISEFCKSHVDGKVRETATSKKWIPFAYDWGGNHLAIDFDPGEHGITGQVINCGRDEDEKFVLANSFSEFLNWYLTQLENGNYSIQTEDDGGKSLNTKTPPSGHFLDSVKILFD